MSTPEGVVEVGLVVLNGPLMALVVFIDGGVVIDDVVSIVGVILLFVILYTALVMGGDVVIDEFVSTPRVAPRDGL